jgi:excisionase family DNA binding protein
MPADTRSVRSRLLTIAQAAEQLGVTPRMVRRLTGSRQLPFVKVGRLVRIREDDILDFVSDSTVPSVVRRDRIAR